MKAPLIHVANMVFNEPLAILPRKFKAILQAVGPRLVADHALDDLVRMHVIPMRPGLEDNAVLMSDAGAWMPGGKLYVGGTLSAADIEAQGNGNGRDEQKPYQLTPEGIAIIPVRGTLMKRATWMSMASGCTSYAGLQQAASQALGDPMVKALLLDVDSPGGTTHGCFELSDALYGMRNPDKPIWACANDLAASAAYALASAADRLFVTRTGGVGSIGVFALHADLSELDAQNGVKFTYIFAGEKKVDGNPHQPLSKSAKSDIQDEVDREYEMFVATVARNRGFAGADADTIRETEAGVLFGGNAVGQLADEVATFDQVREMLSTKVNGTKLPRSGNVAETTPESNNASQGSGGALPAVAPHQTVEPKKEEANMPPVDDKQPKAEEKPVTPDAAAPPRDDEDDDDEPVEDGEEEPRGDDEAKGKKAAKPADKGGKVTAISNAPAKRIAELCHISGCPELAADFIMKEATEEDVIKALSERRSKASSQGGVSSYISGQPGAGPGQVSVDQAIEQARVMSANSGGQLSQTKCFEQLLRRNPQIYSDYIEEKGAIAAQVAFSGSGRALTEYVLNTQRRYMANLGLSTAIDAMPVQR